MSCVKPLKAWRGVGGAIVFNERLSKTRVPFQLPCGRCIGCRMEKARQWGLRCLHEKKMWPDNSYVTLTYATENLPPGGTLSVRDVQLFMKRLRKARNSCKENPVRFFLGGEYGEENKRPHYHALLFNVGFPDKKFWTKNKRDEPLYTSEELSSLWSVDGQTLGFCSIGEVTFDSAVYCAKYSMKKVTGDKADEHYCVYDSDGVLHQRRPEFAVMSRRPGIGMPYYAKYGQEIRDHDSVVVNAKEVRPPKYYDDQSVKFYAGEHSDDVLYCRCDHCKLKRQRKKAALAAKDDNTPVRLAVKEEIMRRSAANKERKI